MTADLTRPRPDLTYLRRRIKPGHEPAPVTSAVAAAPSRNLLSLTPDAPKPVLPAKPGVTGRAELTTSSPVVRLNRRQSAIGSLTIDGTTLVAWETTDRATGVLTGPGSEPAMPVFANRPVVEFHEGQLVVGLRHIHRLRRVVAAVTDQVVVTIHDGATITCTGGALLLSVIDGCLELRREPAPTGAPITEAFTIGGTR